MKIRSFFLSDNVYLSTKSNYISQYFNVEITKHKILKLQHKHIHPHIALLPVCWIESRPNTSFVEFPAQVSVMVPASEVDILLVLCCNFAVVKLYYCLD